MLASVSIPVIVKVETDDDGQPLVLPQARCYGNDQGSKLLAPKDRPVSTDAATSRCRRPVHGPKAGACLFMDLFSHWGGVCFFLRCGAFLVLLGTARDFLLVAGPVCREAAVIVGVTEAL